MNRRITIGLLLSAALLAPVIPATADAEIAMGVNGAARGSDFAATFTLRRFVTEEGRLVAVGALRDVPGLGVVETAHVPVTDVSGTCEVLHVQLGPTEINLDGLSVHLNQFGLHVSDPSGGPLGQSVCSVSQALTDGTPLVSLLNHLVNLFGCLMREGSRCSSQVARSRAAHVSARPSAHNVTTSPLGLPA